MSLYTECSAAARKLLGNSMAFTEDHVVQEAGLDGPEALHHAAQILAAKFRSGHAIRFGPVSPDGSSEQDYARSMGKILYASRERDPHPLVTPNGSFATVTYANDPITKNGRRKGSKRSDMIPWGEQPADESQAPEDPVEAADGHATDLAVAHHRIDTLEAENARLREEIIEDVLARLVERITPTLQELVNA